MKTRAEVIEQIRQAPEDALNDIERLNRELKQDWILLEQRKKLCQYAFTVAHEFEKTAAVLRTRLGSCLQQNRELRAALKAKEID